MDRARLYRSGKIVALAGGAVLVVACAAIYWLTATDAGFRYLLGFTQRVPGVTITATGVSGTPARGFSVDRLVIDHQRVRIEIDALRARISPVFLLGRRIAFSELAAAAVRVHVKPRLHPPDPTPPVFLPSFLTITADRAEVASLVVDDTSGVLFSARQIGAAVAVTSTRIRLLHAGVDAGAYRVLGDAEFLAADPLGLAGTVDVIVPLQDGRLVAHSKVGGSLDRLQLDVALERPAGIRYVGALDLTGAPRLDGRLTLATDDLAPLAAGSPLGRVDGTLTVSGTLSGLSISGPVKIAALPVGAIAVDAEGRYVDDTLEFVRARAAAPGNGPAIEASGRIRFKPRTTVDLDARWQHLRWPLSGRADVESSAGTAHLEGDDALLFRVGGDLGGPGLPPTAVTADGRVRATTMELAHLRAATLGGEITASGRASWAGMQEWTLTATGRRLNPAALRPKLAGRVNFAASASGHGYAPHGFWTLNLASLSGDVRGHPVAGAGEATMRAGTLELSHAHVRLASLAAAGSGSFGTAADIVVDASVGDVGDFVVGGGGSVKLHAAYRAARGTQQLNANIDAHQLKVGAVTLDTLAGRANIDTASELPSTVTLAARGLKSGDARVDALDVAGSGIAAAHELHVTASSGERHAALLAQGSYAPVARSERLEIETLDLDAPRLARYALVAPAVLAATPVHGTLEHTCVASGDSQLCVGGDWQSAGAWHVAADAVGIPVALLPVPLPKGGEWSGALSAHAAATGHGDAPPTGQAQVALDGIEFRYRAPSGRTASLRVGSGTVTATAADSAYQLAADVRTTADSYLNVDAHAQRLAEHSIAELPLTGHLKLRTRELDAIPILVHDLDRVSGLLEADVKLDGTVGQPSLDGTLAFSDGAADVYLSNLRLKQVAATVGLHGRSLDLDASAHAGAGQMASKGTLDWSDGKPSGVLSFSGENLLVANLPEAHVVASPDVRLAIKGDHIEVRGEIRVPSANIAPKDMSNAVRASGDEVVVGAQGGPAESPFTIDSQVKVTLGSDVRVAASGLKGLVAGSIMVNAKTDELVTGTGELEIKDGHYLAYARELDIERGRLLFRGGPVDNAGLDIRASKKLPGYTAGINVRGTMQAPQISFFSDPSLPQSQIASLLIVGQATDVGNGGSLLAAQGGALLVGDYTHYLGVDQMTIESDSSNGTALVLGKFLSPRLYVSYGISLAQAINTLKLRYTIGDNWVINTESGLNHSADIQYTFKR